MEANFSDRPFLVIWETTHACDLACVHCRAQAAPERDPNELTYAEGLSLISDIKKMGAPILVFSGGDPLKRKDVAKLIYYAKAVGLRTGAIPAVTPLLTKEALRELKAVGLDQVAFSLDAVNAEEHDEFRRVKGVFEHTLKAVKWANEMGLHVQINSLINIHNLGRLDELIGLVRNMDIVFWEIFFLVPVGRGKDLTLLSASKFEEAFEKIYQLNLEAKFVVKVTEAPHYRRFYFEKEMKKQGVDVRALPDLSEKLPSFMVKTRGMGGGIGHSAQSINAGKGFVFISYKGDVFPSGFLPVKAGNVREKGIAEIYREAPVLRELRDPDLLKGRCGICAYKRMCGGSRSRAYALTGDYLEEDPSCAYDPAAITNGV